jgi:hypothetical protein
MQRPQQTAGYLDDHSHERSVSSQVPFQQAAVCRSDSQAPLQQAAVGCSDSHVLPRRMSARLRSQAAATSASVSSKKRSAPAGEETAHEATTHAAPALAPLVIPSPRNPDHFSGTAPQLLPHDPGKLVVRLTPNSEKFSGDADQAVRSMGWGARKAAGACGPHLIARQLALAAAYYRTPLAAAAQLGAERSEQQSVLPAAFLSSCQEQLDRVCKLMFVYYVVCNHTVNAPIQSLSGLVPRIFRCQLYIIQRH